MLLFVGLLGCPDPVETEMVAPIEIVETELPRGRETVLYSHTFEATGGEGPLTWRIDGALPPDLVFNPAAGAISGVPRRQGIFPFTLSVSDAGGRSDEIVLELEVRRLQRQVGCGESRQGSLEDTAFVSFQEIDWANEDGYTFIQIPLPDDATTRLDIEVDIGTVAYLRRPGVPAESQDVPNDYLPNFGDLQIDLGSRPDLETYRSFGDALELVVMNFGGPGDYGVSVECTDGPIFDALEFTPVRLGDPLSINYNVVGPDQGMTFSIVEGSLPPWATLDPDTGRVTGEAKTRDTWEYGIRVDAPDGTFREERSGIGVYEPVDIPCGAKKQPFAAEQGYFQFDDGLDGSWNPKGFVLLHVRPPDDASAVEVQFELPTSSTATLTDPPFAEIDGFGSSSVNTFREKTVEPIAVGPRSWPTLEQFDGPLAFLVRRLSTELLEATISVTCDRSPRVGRAELPVLDEGGPSSRMLPVTGGTPPFTFSHGALPPGITLSGDGVLANDGTATGAPEVDITVTDDVGASFTDTFPAPVGDDAACSGAVLGCGEGRVFDGGFDTFCLSSDAAAREWVAARVTADTKDSEVTTFYGSLGAMRVYRAVSQSQLGGTTIDVRFDGSTWPPLDAYAGTVVPMAVDVQSGSATVSVQCGE